MTAPERGVYLPLVSDPTAKKNSVEELLDDVEAYLEDWFQGKLPFAFTGRVRWAPPTDVFETERDFRITLAIPGIRVEDCRVSLERDTVTVRGVRREVCGERRRYHKMEIPVGPFERRIRLSRPVHPDAVNVRYEDGLLRVVVVKSPPEAREIPID